MRRHVGPLAAAVALAVPAGVNAARAALPIPSDARAGTCATGTYTIHFTPGRSTVVRAGTRVLASATLRARGLARSCPRIPVLPRTSLDEAFLGAPIYRGVAMRCRIPEKPGVEVHRLRFQPLGSGLTISIDGHLVASVVLRPQGSSLRVASLFCRRNG